MINRKYMIAPKTAAFPAGFHRDGWQAQKAASRIYKIEVEYKDEKPALHLEMNMDFPSNDSREQAVGRARSSPKANTNP